MSALALPLLALMLVWLVYTLTAYALPCIAGLVAATYAFETGSGWFGACVVFGATAPVVFGLMRWLFAVVEHPTARIMLSIGFVTPAVLMSYFLLESLSAHDLVGLPQIVSDQAWLRHFSDYELKPLFPQLTRPRRTLGPEHAEAESLEDRQGWAMDTFKLRAAATKLGWKRGPILDGGSFDTYEKALPGIGLTAILSFSGSMVPEQNVRAALHGVRFTRTHASRTSPLSLADAPPVLLSEVWNDYHDIAAAGAFDPDWENIYPW